RSIPKSRTGRRRCEEGHYRFTWRERELGAPRAWVPRQANACPVGVRGHPVSSHLHKSGHFQLHLRASRQSRHEGNRNRSSKRRHMKPRFFFFILAFASLMLAQQGNTDNYRGGLVTPPLPKPTFVLTDTSGAAFDFRQR